MSSAYLKAMHHRRADDQGDKLEKGDVVVFTSNAPDRYRNETRSVSEALFKPASASAYGSAAQIEANVRNRELGLVKEKHGATVVQLSTTVSTVVPADSAAPAAPAAAAPAAHKKKAGAGKLSPDEVYRLLRSDETYLRLKTRFEATKAAADALAVAKHLVGVSAVEAERFFKEALACDPTHVKTLATYAVFLETVKKEMDQAEKMYQAAALSGEMVHIRAYATFVREIRGDERLADKILRAGEAAESAADDRTHHRRRRGDRPREPEPDADDDDASRSASGSGSGGGAERRRRHRRHHRK